MGLTVAFEQLADRVLLVELDEQVAAVWRTILGDDWKWLVNRILSFNLTLANLQTELSRKAEDTKHLAFQTILRNRTFHGGILAPGSRPLKHGEKGKGLRSRWYPETLARRIGAIAGVRSRIDFEEGDGFGVLRRYSSRDDYAFYIDPPYTIAGKRAGTRLYTYHDVDHEALFDLVSGLEGDFLMTYDDANEVAALADEHHLQHSKVPMKTTHHVRMMELLIGRNLEWLRI